MAQRKRKMTLLVGQKAGLLSPVTVNALDDLSAVRNEGHFNLVNSLLCRQVDTQTKRKFYNFAEYCTEMNSGM